MKVKLIKTLIGKAKAGEVIDLPDATAKRLIEKKVALPVKSRTKRNTKAKQSNVETRGKKRKSSGKS